MSRIRLTWTNASTTIVEQRVYRSTSPLDIGDMPDPLAVLPRRNREYLDSTIEDGLAYYYAVSSVLPDYSELISEQIKVEATPAESDPHWDKVVALLHFDGPDGSAVAIEEKGIPMSVTRGTPSLSNIAFKFGGTSWHTTDGRISSPLLAYLAFGVEDFTVEAFVMPTNLGARSEQVIVCMRNQPAANGQILALQNGRLGFSNGAVWRLGNTVLSENVWSHAVVSREAGVLRFFVNGVLDGQVTDNTNFTGSRILSIGDFESNHLGGFYGFIDELRITKGVARYTENFTPPAKAFPNN